MGWFALCSPGESWVAAPKGGEGVLLRQGSLVIETRLPQLRRLKPLVSFSRGGDWPLHFALHALPDGGLAMVLDQGGELLHRIIDCADTGRADILRITYAWDAPRRFARLVVERTDQDQIALLPCHAPTPFRRSDIAAMMQPRPERYLSPEVLYFAASDALEPVGPMPSLAPQVPIATPEGERPAGTLRRGDTVLTPGGEAVPVLHALRRRVPARGSFAPLCLRAPYFGLRRDIVVAPIQKLLITGSEVEYLFGREAVQLQAGHLLGAAPVQRMPQPGRFVDYVQLLLPAQETLVAAGSAVDSLYVGRLRRKPEHLHASLLAGIDRASLPEHGQPAHPVLRAFDAIVLAEHRAA